MVPLGFLDQVSETLLKVKFKQHQDTPRNLVVCLKFDEIHHNLFYLRWIPSAAKGLLTCVSMPLCLCTFFILQVNIKLKFKSWRKKIEKFMRIDWNGIEKVSAIKSRSIISKLILILHKCPLRLCHLYMRDVNFYN